MTYKKLIEEHQSHLDKENQSFERISRLRLITFICVALSLTAIFYFKILLIGWIIFSIFFIAFVYLIYRHNKVSQQVYRLKTLIEINHTSIQRLNNQWHDFEDEGAEYVNANHPYTRDLDIFGKASLFQWINVTNTPGGRIYLKNLLENPYHQYGNLKEIQTALQELSQKVKWRQEFQYLGLQKSKKKKKDISIDSLLEDTTESIPNKSLHLIFKLSPVLLIAAIIMASFSTIAYISAVILIIIHLIILGLYKKRFTLVFKDAGKFKTIIKKYGDLLRCFEDETFQSTYLNRFKETVINKEREKASQQIKELQTILELIDVRQSFIHLIVNILTLWDIHCLISLEKWKSKNAIQLPKWVDALSQLECLSSLAIIQFDNPDWIEPSFIEGNNKIFYAENLAHPLIHRGERVNNNFELTEIGEIAVITGSNMSGKSTFLRTVGMNLLFAYLGLPVCAKEFQCAKMKIFTSMRITDNLDEHISSFYAELLRIKQIIDLAAQDELTLFLIDEIFRGTNSKDRITGAREILKTLSLSKTVGLVTTHDLELTDLANNKNLKINNYHFMESYQEGKIIFDYKIRDGIATTTNALYLMKMVGIDVQDNEH